MEITEITQFISNLGFPIFVCVWLLFRSDKKEEQTQTMLGELKIAIEKLAVAQGGKHE
jgi:hypothetical protein